MNNLLKLMCIGVMFSGMALADFMGESPTQWFESAAEATDD